MTIFLKFESEDQFLCELNKLNISPSSEIKVDGFFLSVIGKITDGKEEIIIDDDGKEIKQPTYLDGWHVNMILTSEFKMFDKYRVDVKNPVRIFG